MQYSACLPCRYRPMDMVVVTCRSSTFYHRHIFTTCLNCGTNGIWKSDRGSGTLTLRLIVQYTRQIYIFHTHRVRRLTSGAPRTCDSLPPCNCQPPFDILPTRINHPSTANGGKYLLSHSAIHSTSSDTFPSFHFPGPHSKPLIEPI
jgi:hypothetical protein